MGIGRRVPDIDAVCIEVGWAQLVLIVKLVALDGDLLSVGAWLELDISGGLVAVLSISLEDLSLGWALLYASIVAGETVMQDGVIDCFLPVDLSLKRFFSLQLELLSLIKHFIIVDAASLLCDTCVFENVETHNVVLVEALSPSLRDAVLDFVFDG